MKKIQTLINHQLYISHMKKNSEYEMDRLFCHHDFNHVMDVARISYIISLENDEKLSKDIIYACALLHDIGRWKEYESGVDHALVGGELAFAILVDCGFNSNDIILIQEAIKNHRNKESHPSRLSEILYKSDKLSRPCHQCGAKPLCKRFLNGEQFYLEY